MADDDEMTSQLTFGAWTYAALPDNIKTIKSVIRRTLQTDESVRIIRLQSRAYAKGLVSGKAETLRSMEVRHQLYQAAHESSC